MTEKKKKLHFIRQQTSRLHSSEELNREYNSNETETQQNKALHSINLPEQTTVHLGATCVKFAKHEAEVYGFTILVDTFGSAD